MNTFDDEKKGQVFANKWYKRNKFRMDRSQSCKQYDVLLAKNGNNLKIEEKFLFTREYEKMLVEIMQCLEKPDLGWFYHVDCDYIHWFYCSDDRNTDRPICVYQIIWNRFKPYILDILKQEGWNNYNQCPLNYGYTLNFPVTWKELMRHGIARRYDLTNAL